MSISDISFERDSLSLFSECWPSYNSWSTTLKITSLKIASYLTEPACKVREYFYTFYILDQSCKTSVDKIAKAAFLAIGIVAYMALTPFTAPLGAMVRGAVIALESKPYIYEEKASKGKGLPQDKKMTLICHNECYVPGGYAITDGQVTPASDRARMDRNIQKIKELNPDVVCLFEVPDILDSSYLSAQLSEYPFVIPVAGVRVIGPSSMMYIASKYQIARDSIEFVPFVKEKEITGRAKFSEKGFLSFDLKSQGENSPFATVIATHLQHSEVSSQPEEEDRASRALQMEKIARKIQAKVEQGRGVIFTGDLNLDEEELQVFLDAHQIDWLRRDPSVIGVNTWGGDKWCAELMGKPVSGPMVLDYTLIAGKVRDISTKILGTGYLGEEFRIEAGSDHDLLFNTITFE